MPPSRVPRSAPGASRILVLLITIAAVIVAVLPRSASFAQATVNPADYALDASLLPAGSQVMQSEEAPTWMVDGEHLQVGPASADGRLTGWYMQIQLPTDPGAPPVTLTYLVSIFLSADNAATAVSNQTAFWGTLIHPNPLMVDVYPPPGQGDAGSEYWYGYHDVNSRTHEEHYFQRGRVFIEVNLDLVSGTPTDAQTQGFLQVARLLDTIATQGPLGTATPTPTATATPTATPTVTPTPTSTPTPRPTSTPKPTPTHTPVLKVIREGTSPPTPKPKPTTKPKPKPTTRPKPKPTRKPKPKPTARPCKKGYHRVKGACKKIKK